jgi:hypothetical protein
MQQMVEESVGLSSGAIRRINVYAMGTKLATWLCVEVCSVIQLLRIKHVSLIENHCLLIEVYGDGVIIVQGSKE